MKVKKKQQLHKMELLVQRKRQEHLELLAQLDKLEVKQQQPQKPNIDQDIIIEPTFTPPLQISARWLMNLRPTLTYECEPVVQEETELDQIIKHQLREKIIRQKEFQKQQYNELVEELKLQQKHQVYDEKVREDFQCTYQYQSQGKAVSINIKYYDYSKLNPQNYVNDTIINFFLRFLENDILKNQQVVIYNTYFCARLLSFQQDVKQLYVQYLQNNNQLQRWTKNDIFNKQYLLFPLHLREHWAAMFVVNPLGVCEQLCGVSNGNTGYFIYFDSLLMLDQRIGIQIKFHLLHVYNALQKKYTNDQIYDFVLKSKVQVYQPIVPRQTNLVDCGLYMLEYVERFLSNPNTIIQNLEADHLEWFPKVMIFIKRILIKKILHGLSQNIKDYASKYYDSCRLIDEQFKTKNQYDYIDESLLEQLQVPRLQFHLSEDYNYYYEMTPNNQMS